MGSLDKSLQVPRYPGYALDPPLRSRFQAREVSGFSISAQYAALRAFVPEMTAHLLQRLLSAVEAIRALENTGCLLPPKHLLNSHLISSPNRWPDEHSPSQRKWPAIDGNPALSLSEHGAQGPSAACVPVQAVAGLTA